MKAIAFLLLSAVVVPPSFATDTTELVATANRAESTRAYRSLEQVVVEAARDGGTVALDSVVSTGSRLDIPARDLPASISVVPQPLIQLRGARTALEAVYGAVGMTGGNSVGSIPNYATRGFSGNDITVMRDGIRQNTGSQASRPVDSFLLERIEVLKGPASLLHGEGAVGGAINYVSKQPDKEFKGEAIASVGSWDSYRIGFGAGGPTGIDNLYFRADVSTNHSGGYVDDSAATCDAFAGALRWEPSERTGITLSATWLRDDVSSYYGTPVVYDAVIDQRGTQVVRKANTTTDTLVNARIDGATRRLNYNHRDNFVDAENTFWRLIVDTELSDTWSLRNELYATTQRMDWQNTESTVWNPVTRRVDRSGFFIIYRDDLQIGDRLDLSWRGELFGRPNQFLIGALYDSNEQKRNSGQSYPDSPIPASVPLLGFDRGFAPDVRGVKTLKVVTDTAAVYVENVFDATDAVKLVGGLRYDEIDVERRSYLGAPDFTKSYHPTTGRLGVVYTVAPSLNLYASYSRAAQPVAQLVSLTAAQDDFSLQTGIQYEIGAKADLWDKRGELTFALFDIEKQDLLTSEIIGGVRVNSQIGAQVSQGAELALALAPTAGWRVDLNLAWTWTAEFEDFNENVGSGVIARDGNTPPNVPKLVAGLFVAKEFGAWIATAGLRHVGEREANNNNGIQLDAYTTVDASLGYRWRRASATLWGRNLTDEEYVEWASGGGLMQRLADPRSVELSLKYAF